MRQLHFDLLRLLEDDRQGRSPAGRSVSSTAGRAARAVPGASPSTRTPPTLRFTGFWRDAAYRRDKKRVQNMMFISALIDPYDFS